MQLRILLVFLACCLTGNSYATDSDSAFTLYLVRHAEKQVDGSRDPALTGAGKLRAEQLATGLKDKGITAIWSSDYKRTRSTAQPLLAELGLELNIYDPGNQALLVGQLLARQSTTLIVGHSNTIPELARLLCERPIAEMDETEYDRLIVISVNDENIQVKTLQQSNLFQTQN